jgi:amidase
VPDATALAAAIADGLTTAREVMEASLAACDAQAALGAVVHLDNLMARAGAEAADMQPKDQRGPFHGVPFLVKDLGAFAKGLPASAGAVALRNIAERPAADSDLVAAFRTTGLIPFGLSATPPFGLALSTEPEGMEPARNPWNRALTPGGSSGGSAAAVASGIVAMAHATDAAGSIRVPAACCGLMGLKPSRGAVPGGPDFSNHLMGIASELVLARSVRDVETIFACVRAPGPPRALPDRIRIGLALPERCDATQTAAARAAADALTDAGCTVFEIAAPDRLGAQALGLAQKILSVSLAEWLAALDIADDRVPALASTLVAEGRAITGMDVFVIARDVARLSDTAHSLFYSADAVLTSILASRPPAVGAFDLSKTDTDTHFAQMEALAPNAALANVAGLSAFAQPFGMADGLPVGVQLLGPQGSDLLLCHLAALIEARAPTILYPNKIAGMPT